MKLVKIISILLVFISFMSLVLFNYFKTEAENYKTPLDTQKSTFYQNLKYALNKNKITPTSDITFNNYTGKVYFQTSSPKENQSVNIVFSVNKDPYLQSTTLQKILSEATIKGKYVHFIDLSINHPYVTFKDN